MKLNLIVNGDKKSFLINQDEYILDVLRRNNYLSVRRGCDSTSCGVCTILLNGKPVPSCSLLAVRCENQEITTVEGIEKEVEKLAKHFGDLGADQCGFCNPSMALTVYALKQENPQASLEEIREYLVGNLCRCTGYVAQNEAVKNYLGDQS